VRTDRILVALIVVLVIGAAVLAGVKVRRAGPDSTEMGLPSNKLSLLVIGISGFEDSVFERLSAEGRLPNLTALSEEGAVGRYSTLPRGTDPRIIWTSLMTGVAPENQGVGGKVMSPRGDLVSAPLVPESRTAETIWTILGNQEQSSGVLGWPGTWPAETVNGVTVVPHSTFVLERSHGGAPGQLVYPVAEYEAVSRLIIDPLSVKRSDLALFVNMESVLGLEALIGQNYTSLENAYASDRSMTDVAWLVTGNPGVANAFVCLTGTDVVSQRFWHYMDRSAMSRLAMGEEELRLLDNQAEALGVTIDRYYEFVDGLVGQLVALADPGATVAVVTDFGYSGVSLNASGQPMIGSSMHSERGMCILRGPRVIAGARANGASILDVAPTIMAASSIPLPAKLDGHVIESFIEE
jgi:predicted AlkP superfamily phosphohydrolase/phosphomutase